MEYSEIASMPGLQGISMAVACVLPVRAILRLFTFFAENQ